MQITFPAASPWMPSSTASQFIPTSAWSTGGAKAGPEPFELFLASLGTCAGLFVLRFCRQRGIDTAGLGLTL